MSPVKTKPKVINEVLIPICKNIWPIPIAILIVFFYSRDPVLTELGYSTSFYPMISNLTAAFGNFIPASLAELFLISFSLMAITLTIKLIFNVLRSKKAKRGKMLFDASLVYIRVISLIILAFSVLCAPNYHRQPFTFYSGHVVAPGTPDELIKLSTILAKRTDEARRYINTNEYGNMIISGVSLYEVAKDANATIKKFSGTYPVLGGATPPPKPVSFSVAMNYLGITGFYFPYFCEANFNSKIPHAEMPYVMLHELAHAHGFMREDEANFIAYLSGRDSDNPDFVYSANFSALNYCLNDLSRYDYDAYVEIWNGLSEGVKDDFREMWAHWEKYDGTLTEVSETVNNAYLMVNSQSDGIKSYGAVVNLLLAEYRTWDEEVT